MSAVNICYEFHNFLKQTQHQDIIPDDGLQLLDHDGNLSRHPRLELTKGGMPCPNVS